jgi:Fe-S-cluster-containing dehydrogenase component
MRQQERVTSKAFVIDTRNCVGCLACEVACKQEHGIAVDSGWIKVRAEDPYEVDGRPRLRYTVTYCLHCIHPPCQDACPTGAITKRDDGIVLVDSESCVGCGACVDACPEGVMQFDNERGVVQKCDLCIDRVDRGILPACAVACVSHCIHFGEVAEILRNSPELGVLLRDRGVCE